MSEHKLQNLGNHARFDPLFHFVLLPFLAPTFLHLGLTGVGNVIYLAYRPTCHQLPERSFFLFGSQSTYTVAALEADGTLPPGTDLVQREALRYPGNPEIGYKVAICERDVAIYGSMLLGGLIFALARKRYAARGRTAPKLPIKVYLALLIPMGIDGTTQLLGLRESTWELRLITGVLFGLATVWLAYPYVEDAMSETVAALPRQGPAPAETTP